MLESTWWRLAGITWVERSRGTHSVTLGPHRPWHLPVLPRFTLTKTKEAIRTSQQWEWEVKKPWTVVCSKKTTFAKCFNRGPQYQYTAYCLMWFHYQCIPLQMAHSLPLISSLSSEAKERVRSYGHVCCICRIVLYNAFFFICFFYLSCVVHILNKTFSRHNRNNWSNATKQTDYCSQCAITTI